MAVASASAVERFLPRTGLVAEVRPAPVLGVGARGELVRAVDRNRERADVVARGSDVVGQAAIRPRVAVARLLAQEAETGSLVEYDVVAVRARGPVPVDAAGLQRSVPQN